MSVASYLSFLLPLVIIETNGSDLWHFIRRIHNESNSVNLCFVGFEKNFLDDYVQSNVGDLPVMIFPSPPIENSEKPFQNTMLVLNVIENGPDITKMDNFVSSLQVRSFVVVYASNLNSLHENFRFLARKKFKRIFGMSEGTRYSYLPYADNPLQVLLKDDPIPDALKDLNGFAVRTTIQENFPRTFWYKNLQGKSVVGGCFGQMVVNFLQQHNATFEEVQLNESNNFSKMEIVDAIKTNEVDISMNAFSETQGIGYSYPVKTLSWAILVPINGHLNPQEYFLRPFSSTQWLIVLIIFVNIVVMDVVKDFCCKDPVVIWRSISRTFLSMLGMSDGETIRKAYRFYALVFLFAFVSNNFYLIFLKSFLTVYIELQQFHTIDDLIENNLRVMLPDYDWEAFKDDQPEGFDKIAVAVDGAIYSKELYSMTNTTLGYAIGLDKAEFLIKMQSRLETPLFKILEEGLYVYQVSIPFTLQTPFENILNNFIFHVKETGLIEKWDNDAVIEGFKAGLRTKASSVDQGHSPLTLVQLKFAWSCLAFGFTSAMMGFLLEKLGSRF